MTEPFEVNTTKELDAEHQLLLGRPCQPESRGIVLEALAVMDDTQRSLVYEWGMFGLADLAFLAYDQVKNYRDYDKERADPVAQEAALSYVADILSWLDLVKVSEKIPLLDRTPPDDKVGEEIDFFMWAIEDGGANDQLVAEQIEYVQGQLERYKLYIKGETKMAQMPDSIASHIPQQTQAEKAAREQSEYREAAKVLLELLAPALMANNKMLSDMGIDPLTLQNI